MYVVDPIKMAYITRNEEGRLAMLLGELSSEWDDGF